MLWKYQLCLILFEFIAYKENRFHVFHIHHFKNTLIFQPFLLPSFSSLSSFLSCLLSFVIIYSHFFPGDLFIYLFIGKAVLQREKVRQREMTSVCRFVPHKWPQCPVLGQAETRRFIEASHVCSRCPSTWADFSCFLMPLALSWIGSRIPGNQHHMMISIVPIHK